MTRATGFRASALREWRFLAQSPWDRAMLTWMPLVLCAIVAWQLSGGVVRDLPVLVIAQDDSALTRDLAIRIEAAPGLRLAGQVPDLAAAERLIRAHRAYGALLVPANTTQRALHGQAPVTLYFNASYPAAAAAIQREVGAVVDAANARYATDRIAAVAPQGSVRPAPVRAITTIAWNAPGSQELQLVSLLHPALLHLIFMLAVVSAFGRELRAGSIGEWAPNLGDLAGKAAPYVAVFMGWALLTIVWLAGVRGWPFAGSPLVLVAGYAAMYLAYLGIALLIVGATRTLSQSLSITGLYAGASFAFAGAIFPLEQASSFAKAWGNALPYTHFARLLARTWIAPGDGMALVWPLLAMLGMALVTAVPGARLYLRAAREPASWGRR